MTLFQALLLGILQGFAEFLPISSSGHLVLLEAIFGLKLEELKGFDVILHLGSLVAILVYFRRDLWGLLHNFKLAAYLVIATVPAMIVGFTLEDQIDAWFRDPKAVLAMLFILGVFFLIVERIPAQKTKTEFTLKNTFLMGLAQAIALIPGISRSGSIMGTGLLTGLKRDVAARFAFLLGVPAIAGAVFLTGIHVLKGEVSLPGTELVLIGFVTSAGIGYFTISFLMRFLKNHRLTVFAIYLMVVSAIAFLLLFGL